MYEKESVNAFYIESRVFFSGSPVSSHRKCWHGGLGSAPNPSTVAVIYDQTWVITWLPHVLLESLRLHQVELGWAAFFVIQLSSQLQVRMTSTPSHSPMIKCYCAWSGSAKFAPLMLPVLSQSKTGNNITNHKTSSSLHCRCQIGIVIHFDWQQRTQY